jgi:methylmalonyl-CoA mutase
MAEHTARLQYAQNFFAAGGISAVPSVGDAAWHAQGAESSGCQLACICGSDKRYATDAVENGEVR